MVLISKEFPTRFISGKEVTKPTDVTIKEVKRENVYSRETRKNEQVLVIYFEGAKRGVSLKKSRAHKLAELCGSDDTDKWKGKTVCMIAQKMNAFGKELDVISFTASKKALDKELDSIALSQ